MTYSEKAHLNAVMIGTHPDTWTDFWMQELFGCETDAEVRDCLSEFFDEIEESATRHAVEQCQSIHRDPVGNMIECRKHTPCYL